MDRFDRQRQIFGDGGQERLGSATVGVVGGGGLGSFVVLELAYLGVGRIVIVDDDFLEPSNRNRLVGAWESHPAGVPKVAVLRDLALMIDSGLAVEAVRGRLDSEKRRPRSRMWMSWSAVSTTTVRDSRSTSSAAGADYR